jgi:hypothetical protein
MDDLTDRERDIIAALEAELAAPPPVLPVAPSVLPWMPERLPEQPGQRTSPTYRVVRSPRPDDGGGGFPPIDPPMRRYGGRPGRGDGRGRGPLSSVTFLLAAAAFTAVLFVDSTEQRQEDWRFATVGVVVCLIGAAMARGRERR